MMIKATVDRVEGDWFIIIPETGTAFQIPTSLFPGLKEGDVVRIFLERDEPGKKFKIIILLILETG